MALDYCNLPFIITPLPIKHPFSKFNIPPYSSNFPYKYFHRYCLGNTPCIYFKVWRRLPMLTKLDESDIRSSFVSMSCMFSRVYCIQYQRHIIVASNIMMITPCFRKILFRYVHVSCVTTWPNY